MTPAEVRAWSSRLRAYQKELEEVQNVRGALERNGAWFDTAFLAALDYQIRHSLNILMLYGMIMIRFRRMTTDPRILREIDLCLMWDDLGRPELDAATEARFRELRARCWDRLFERAKGEMGDGVSNN